MQTPPLRSLAWRTDLALLQAAGSTVEDLGTHLLVTSEQEPAFHWGNFLLLRQPPGPGAALDAVGVFDAWFPDAGHRAIGIDGYGSYDTSEFEAAGLEVDVSEVLVAHRLTEPAHRGTDAGYRPLVESEIGLWVDLEVSAHRHTPGWSRAFVEARAAAEWNLVRAGLGHRWGAFVDGRLAATAGLYSVGHGDLRYQSVLTHPRHRRRGHAGTLLYLMGRRALADRQHRRLVIVAEREGAAIELYRSLGFQTLEQVTSLSETFG